MSRRLNNPVFELSPCIVIIQTRLVLTQVELFGFQCLTFIEWEMEIEMYINIVLDQLMLIRSKLVLIHLEGHTQ